MPERVHLDRIEGERAILLCGEDGRQKIELPARLLPDGCKEGDAMDLALTPAPGDTTRADVQNLMDDLFGETEKKS